jgi:Tol biopolymer transport system component
LIAFSKGDSLYGMSLSGTAVRRIKRFASTDLGRPAWSPDGGRLAFFYDGSIWGMRADGTDLRKLLALPPAAHSGWSPTWAPDGARIAYPSGDGVSVANVDGTGTTLLVEGNGFQGLKWSPDGTRFVFHRWDPADHDYEIWVMDADGNNQLQLTDNTADDLNPDWAVDGSSLAFVSDRTGNREIFRMLPTGGGQVNLTNTSRNEGNPIWSPRGDRIAFVAAGIWVMPTAGGTPVQVTSTSGDIDWQPVHVTLRVSDITAAFEQTVTVTAQVTGDRAGRTVAIYERPLGASEALVATGTTDTQGRFALNVILRSHTRFRVQLPPDNSHPAGGMAYTTVRVRAKVTGRMVGGYATSGKYRLYHYRASCPRSTTGCPAYQTTVLPNHAGEKVAFTVQWRRNDTWRTVLRFTGALDATSRARFRLIYTDRRIIGAPTRIRVRFAGDNDHDGQTATWSYVKVTL